LSNGKGQKPASSASGGSTWPLRLICWPPTLGSAGLQQTTNCGFAVSASFRATHKCLAVSAGFQPYKRYAMHAIARTIHHSLDGLCCFVSLLVRHVIASVTCLRCCLIRSAGASSCTPCGAGTFYASTGERQSGLCAGYRDRSLA